MRIHSLVCTSEERFIDVIANGGFKAAVEVFLLARAIDTNGGGADVGPATIGLSGRIENYRSVGRPDYAQEATLVACGPARGAGSNRRMLYAHEPFALSVRR